MNPIVVFLTLTARRSSMVWILVIGAVIAIVNVVLTYTELIPFFKSVKQLNQYTARRGIGARLVYPIRFISLMPKLTPLVLDATIAIIAGSIGLGGGVYGALIGLTLGFTASLMVKIHRHFISPKIQTEGGGWRV
jgi:hypothetical protein